MQSDNEPQFKWDARVAAHRLARGEPLGDYLEFDAVVVGVYLWGERAPWRDALSAEQHQRLPPSPGRATATRQLAAGGPPPPPPPPPGAGTFEEWQPTGDYDPCSTSP